MKTTTLHFWKVSYTHLEDRAARHPFFKRTQEVQAVSRAEPVNIVKNQFPPPRYGEYRASKL